jgi:hypothetical protein
MAVELEVFIDGVEITPAGSSVEVFGLHAAKAHRKQPANRAVSASFRSRILRA